MNNTSEVVSRDLATLWHPCSQMKDYETFAPLHVIKAKNSHLFLADGSKILDAISSWWCKHLGHAHPRLLKALIKQTKQFEHVILANTTNNVIVELSESITSQLQQLKKIFYASDGSCAVEIALKLAAHAREIRGQKDKQEIFALANGYHGETLFALAASDVGIYRKPYESYLPKVHFISDIPYLSSQQDPLWFDCGEFWHKTEALLNQHKERLSTIILEPIIQAAGGMLIYSQDYLRRLRQWSSENDVYLIADEIMTGLGRTGQLFACQHANIEPDLMCLGKGLTGGILPMSAVVITNEIYDLFYDDYTSGKSFLHSHTHSGNALAAAVGLECLKVIQDEDILETTRLLEQKLLTAMQQVAEKTNQLKNIRGLGGMVAAELKSTSERLGYQVYRKAVTLGALLRPLGNTLYWLPPLNIKDKEINKLRDITIKAIMQTL
jgi:adenosylmethionine-8-amino-7-oxononanoate aminotransferase